MKIGIDVHKESVYITAMDEDGTIREQYEVPNGYEEWIELKDKYIQLKPDIAIEMYTSGQMRCKAIGGTWDSPRISCQPCFDLKCIKEE